MTISVTPDEAFEPPRNEITVSVPTGAVMTAVAVYRNDSAGRSLTRTQPAAGFDSRTVYDYEAGPYGEPVTYDWTVTYVDPDDYTPTYTEDWSAYPTGWTGDTGLGSETAGVLEFSTPAGAGEIQSTVNFGWQEIQIASFTHPPNATVSNINTRIFFDVETTGDRYIEIGGWTNSFIDVSVDDGTNYQFSHTSGDPLTITQVNNAGIDGILFAGPGDSQFIPWTYGPIQRIRIETRGANQSLEIGEIVAVQAGVPQAIAEESDPVVLNSDRAWLIHPSTVALSFPLAHSDSTVAGIASVDEIVNRSATTLHPIMGSAHPIAVTTGIRNGDETALIVTTVTSDERVALRALLATDFPILIQIPADWDLGFASGFYAVGDAREARGLAVGSDPWRQFRLPLTRVQAPVADVEETSWTWAHVVLEFPTWAAVKATFATWADLATNTRI